VEGFWDKPFLSIEALFEYVTTCRLFWVKQAAEEEAGNDIGVTGGDEGKTKLKSNEREYLIGGGGSVFPPFPLVRGVLRQRLLTYRNNVLGQRSSLTLP